MRFFAKLGAVVLLTMSVSALWPATLPGYAKELGKTCGGIAGLPCEKGYFCEFKTGECDTVKDATGHCVKRPEICNKIYMPVCGCNKKTYGNNCEREAAAVSEAHGGACAKM